MCNTASALLFICSNKQIFSLSLNSWDSLWYPKQSPLLVRPPFHSIPLHLAPFLFHRDTYISCDDRVVATWVARFGSGSESRIWIGSYRIASHGIGLGLWPVRSSVIHLANFNRLLRLVSFRFVSSTTKRFENNGRHSSSGLGTLKNKATLSQ